MAGKSKAKDKDTAPGKTESASFESKLAELEEIVRQLEDGEKPLDESITLFEKGERTRKTCLQILDRFESRIRVLRKNADGRSVLVDEDEEEGEEEALGTPAADPAAAPRSHRQTRQKRPLKQKPRDYDKPAGEKDVPLFNGE